MATLPWSGGWTAAALLQPALRPGDTLTITRGTVAARAGELSGVTVDLGGTQDAPAGLSVTNGAIGALELVPLGYGADQQQPRFGTLDIYGRVTVQGALQSGGRFQAPGSLSVTLHGPATLALGGGGSLSNGAALVVSGPAGATVENDATLVLGGTRAFAIHADLTGAGTIWNSAGFSQPAGTIELDGAVSAAQTVRLDAGTLQLDQPPRFAGTVAGFGATSALRLQHETVSAASFRQLSEAGGELSVFTQDQTTGGAGATLTFHLAGSYGAGAFAFSNDAATQSAVITLAPPRTALA